jgi:hypothetical protein
MTLSWWERWGPLSGALSVVFFVVAAIVFGRSPDTNASDQKILSYYASHSHQVRGIVGFFLIFAALVLFLAFLGALRGRLEAAEGEPGRFTALAFAGGLMSTVLFMVADALSAAPAIATNDTNVFRLDPNTYRLLADLTYVFLVSAVMAAIVLVLPASIVALRTGAVFPRWFAWTGVPVAATFMVAIFFIPILIMGGWVLVASALMLLSTFRAAGPARTAPET